MKEYIVYVKLFNDKKNAVGKMLTHRFITSYKPETNGENWKLIYFEFKSTIRSAQAKEKKLRLLKKNILMDFVRRSNPELLDLKYTINSSNILEELIY